jgi:hypothetical protein
MTLKVGIRGAGVSGLSLAHAILQEIPDADITLADIRAHLPNPSRSFCYFQTTSAYSPIRANTTWSNIKFSGPGFSRKIDCSLTPYTYLEGDYFFNEIIQYLLRAKVTFRWNCQSVEVGTDYLRIDDVPEKFDLVFDSAFQVEDAEPTLWQTFGGLWIESSSPIFEADTATLMELTQSSADSAVNFMYILPTSSCSGLVEHTSFSKKRQDAATHLNQCNLWLSKYQNSGIRIIKEEYGNIPMGLNTKKIQFNSIGTSADAIRMATGYGYQNIQRQARILAKTASLLRNTSHRGTFPPIKTPKVAGSMLKFIDKTFLKALSVFPLQGTKLMEQILANAPGPELISFLAGDSSMINTLRVISKAPKITMLKTLCYG